MKKSDCREFLLPYNALKNKNLGISVSDSPDLDRLGLSDIHFRLTLGELTRIVVIAEGSLYYGGHLDPEGITSFLIDELHRYSRRDQPLKVCLAWNIHCSMSVEEIDEQKEFLGMFGEIYFLSRNGKCLDNLPAKPLQRILTREECVTSLSGLRTFMVNKTDARIVLGGKREGFQGSMPGIFEEVLLSLKRRQPLYLAGGFGGATLDIIRTLRPEHAEWFPVSHEQTPSDEHALKALDMIHEIATVKKWDGYENGLSDEENCLLAASYRPSEIAALVGRGLGQLRQR